MRTQFELGDLVALKRPAPRHFYRVVRLRKLTDGTPAITADCAEGTDSRITGPADRFRLVGAPERGSISLPLLTFQACAAVGLASGLWSLYLRLAAQLGGFAQ